MICPYENCNYEANALPVMELHQNIMHDSTIIEYMGNHIVVPISNLER